MPSIGGVGVGGQSFSVLPQTRISNEKPIDFPLQPSAAKKKENKPLHCYLFFLFFYPSLDGQRRKVIPARSYFTTSICLSMLHLSQSPSLPHILHCLLLLPFACLLLSIYLCLSLSLTLSLPSTPLSPFLSLPGARWWRRVCVGLGEHASGIIQPARMKDSWCSGVCVCMCVPHAQALTGKREQRETEKKGKRVGGWRVQSVRQIDGAQQG